MSLTCYICLEQCNHNTRTLYCNHEFCTTCIDPWIQINSTCPVCREPINERSCVLTSIGKDRIHNYTIENILLNNPVSIVKGILKDLSIDESRFIKAMFGYNIGEILYNMNLDGIYICIVKENTIYFGKKIISDNNNFLLEGGYCIIRNTGVTFPVSPSNRTYCHSQNEIAYTCF